MKKRTSLESILYFFVSIFAIISTNFGFPNQHRSICKFTTSSSNDVISITPCDETNGENISSLSQSTLRIDNLEARWSANINAKDRLLLSTSFSARGIGQAMLKITKSPSLEDELFCGILTKSRTNQNFVVAVNLWLQCRQDKMDLGDKMTLYVQKWKTGRNRREIPDADTFNVELPGCALPEFKHTSLCQKEEEEEKIRFHVRRVDNRRSVRVVLARSIYTSRFDDEERARGRRYHVAILEESPIDVWFGEAGRLIEMKSLKYPNRNVRFRDLEAKKTFVVSVWRAGGVKRYYKKITVC